MGRPVVGQTHQYVVWLILADALYAFDMCTDVVAESVNVDSSNGVVMPFWSDNNILFLGMFRDICLSDC